jgi:hypothetical protein
MARRVLDQVENSPLDGVLVALRSPTRSRRPARRRRGATAPRLGAANDGARSTGSSQRPAGNASTSRFRKPVESVDFFQRVERATRFPPRSACARAGSLRTIEIGVRRSWLASSRKRSCSSAASSSLGGADQQLLPSPGPTGAVDARCDGGDLVGFLDGRAGFRRSASQNQPATDTIRPGRDDEDAQTVLGVIASSSDVPLTTTEPLAENRASGTRDSGRRGGALDLISACGHQRARPS